MVDEVLEYVKSCSRKARELQSLAKGTIDGSEDNLINKCLKSFVTDSTIASQGREQHQRSVFIFMFRGELEFGITSDFKCRKPRKYSQILENLRQSSAEIFGNFRKM